MTRIILFTVLFFTNLLLTAQVSENRTVSGFSKLKAFQGIEVFYTVSDSNSLKVETDDNERLQMIKTEIEGETLKIFVETKNAKKLKSRKWNNRTINGVSFNVIEVYVSGKALTEINASSSAIIKIENSNVTDQLVVATSSSGSISGNFECRICKINVSSSGEIKGKLIAESVFIEANSSGEVTLNGKTTSLDVKANSSADCKLKDLTAENAIVRASSSADVTLSVSKSLDAESSSSAEINYYGNPAQVYSNESSSGSVSKR